MHEERASDDPDGLLAVSDRLLHNLDTRNSAAAAGAGATAVGPSTSQFADEHGSVPGFSEADDCVSRV